MSFPPTIYPYFESDTPTQELPKAAQRLVWLCDGKHTFSKLVWEMELNDDGTAQIGDTLYTWWPFKG